MARIVSAAAAVALLCALPAFAQYDGFQLPPGIENTRIPHRLPSALHYQQDEASQRPPDESIAYSLKEWKLGMSLDEFTRMPLPAGADPKSVKAVCSCEANQSLEVATEDEKRAKTIVCGIWAKPADVVAATPYRMTVAGIECSPDFRFLEDGGIYKLMEISITFYSSNFKKMQDALTAKYGQPVAVRKEKITTGSGNNFEAHYLIWDNGVSRIRLSDVDGNNTTRAKLRFIQLRLISAYNARLDTRESAPTKRASEDL
jgi:hypothetical protein